MLFGEGLFRMAAGMMTEAKRRKDEKIHPDCVRIKSERRQKA